MAKKPRNKKYNPAKHKLLKVHRRLRNLAAVYCTGTNNKVELVDLDTLKPIIIDMQLAADITTTTFEYDVHLYALCIDWEGRAYLKGEEHKFTARYYQKDLVEYLNDRHQQFLEKSVSKEDMVAAAWIAVPVSKKEITNEMAFNIFNNLKGWD